MIFRLLFTGVLLLSGVSTLALAVFAYRHRETPGAVPFAGLSAALAHWAFVYAIGLQIQTPTLRVMILQIQWIAHPTIPLFLLLFGLSYTGHDEWVTRKTVAIVSAIPVLVVVAALTNPWHELLWTAQSVHIVEGMAVLVPTYGPLFWINIVYGYGIEVVAIAVLLRLVYQSDHLYADQSALLLVGIMVPFLANVHEIFIVGSTPAVDYTAISFAVSGLAFGYAVFRRQLFDLIPATRKLGRSDAITQLDTGVLIVDTEDRIVYANPEAGTIFDRDPSAMVGQPAKSVVDEQWLSFDTEDALGEVQRGTRTYEIRTSSITDRSGRELGTTLVFYDVTARTRREQELVTVNELNAVIRGVNQTLPSVTGRESIERAVCDRLAESDLYAGVCIGDVQTWAGDADRWRTTGDVRTDSSGHPSAMSRAPPRLDNGQLRAIGDSDGTELTLPVEPDGASNTWVVVPVVYGQTVYGAMGLLVHERDVSDRERSVLRELGELVGHAIDASEVEALTAADGGVQLTVAVADESDPIAAVTADGEVRLETLGIVSAGSNDGHHLLLDVTAGGAEQARSRLAAAGVEVDTVHGDSGDGLLDIAIGQATSLAPICERNATLLKGTVADGTATYEVFVPSAAEAQALLDRLSSAFPATTLRTKRKRENPFRAADGLPSDGLDELTARQREALGVAYRAGYFEWPREANAEEVAESMGISSPTLHSHLRKAQARLFADVFEGTDDP
ncbi:histidine kinase N-terminal 7TM domain-containing protein [Haloarcula halophila]|uniref:histidine kinase N-terminal 7TM domain-containing protein n=1 Tax=Haloarcula TaxID=2237 RepID=UPI0023E39315|nr:histidine kinase N-terminal 7TM domain-containing protein [Halomicroarcula sp. DFY41]